MNKFKKKTNSLNKTKLNKKFVIKQYKMNKVTKVKNKMFYQLKALNKKLKYVSNMCHSKKMEIN